MNELPAPGWYRDPELTATQRYWDGSRWTAHRAPLAAQTKERGAGALVVVGYVTALLLPIIGFILGTVLLVRRQTGHGLAVVVISLAVGIGACAIALNDADEELNRSLDPATREWSRCLEENGYRFAACRELNPLRERDD